MWISLFSLLDSFKDVCRHTRYCYQWLQRHWPSLYHAIGPSLTTSYVTALILQAPVHSYFRVWSRVRSLERVGFLIQNYRFILALRGCKNYFESKLVYCAVVGALDRQTCKTSTGFERNVGRTEGACEYSSSVVWPARCRKHCIGCR